VNTSTFQGQRCSSVESAKFDDFYSKLLEGSAICAQCGQALLEGPLEGASNEDFEESTSGSHTHHHHCGRCKSQSADRHFETASFHQREQSSTTFTPSFPSIPREQTQADIPIEQMPTKIKALQADLSKYCSREKW